MAKGLFSHFLVRWLVSGLGLWIAESLLGHDRLDISGSWANIVIAGLILALVNTALKPILVILSIPAIILSLGLFMLVVNGLIILIVGWLDSSVYVKNLGVAIVAGIILGLVNYLVTRVLEDFEK